MKKLMITLLIVPMLFLGGCNAPPAPQPEPTVKKATANVEVGADGMTSEQVNVKRRLEEDNKIGAIKHLYIISAYSGQTILYSTVKGKVTSSSKRLTSPVSFVRGLGGGGYRADFIAPRMSDDGTYGSSVPYLYWWDTAGKYHQHYPSGGQIIHVSDQAVRAKSVTMNVEVQ